MFILLRYPLISLYILKDLHIWYPHWYLFCYPKYLSHVILLYPKCISFQISIFLSHVNISLYPVLSINIRKDIPKWYPYVIPSLPCPLPHSPGPSSSPRRRRRSPAPAPQTTGAGAPASPGPQPALQQAWARRSRRRCGPGAGERRDEPDQPKTGSDNQEDIYPDSNGYKWIKCRIKLDAIWEMMR